MARFVRRGPALRHREHTPDRWRHHRGPQHLYAVDLVATGQSLAGMFRAIEESTTLRPVAAALQARAPAPRRSASGPGRDDYLDLLDVRGQVQAMTEQLGLEVEEVLEAVGRGSMRELEVGDRERLAWVFVELRKRCSGCDR